MSLASTDGGPPYSSRDLKDLGSGGEELMKSPTIARGVPARLVLGHYFTCAYFCYRQISDCIV